MSRNQRISRFGYCTGEPRRELAVYQPKRDDWREYDRRWRRLSAIVAAEEPLCRMCLIAGKVTPREHTDHIIPIEVNPALKYVRENLQSLCRSCHTRKTMADRKERGVNDSLGRRCDEEKRAKKR